MQIYDLIGYVFFTSELEVFLQRFRLWAPLGSSGIESVSERWDLHDLTVIYAGRNLNMELLCNLLPLRDGNQVAYWGNQWPERSLFDSKYSAVTFIKWQIFSEHSQ